jgi:hypothetical protein
MGWCVDPAGAEAAREAHVTYVTSSTIYVDAGKADGLLEGAQVEVRRQGQVIARLVVVSTASHRSACRVADGSGSVVFEVGDSISFQPAAPAATPAVVDEPLLRQSRRTGWLRRNGVQGRIAVRFIGLADDMRQNGGYSEPALDARVNAALTPSVRLSVDMRARHTYRAEESVDRTRVYRLLGEWGRPALGPRLVVGRQVASSFASVSLFDGALAEWRSHRWSTGAFTGTQPDPVHYGFSTQTREHGAYIEWREHPSGGSRWQLTMAGIGSYENATVSREYLALQGRVTTRRLYAYVIQEIDFNRSWKAAMGEPRLSLTSILAQARVRLNEVWSVDAGFDNRRNVRLYRDRTTPETEFDDSYRQGMWMGVGARVAARTHVGLRARRAGGGSIGEASSMTATLSSDVPRLTALRLRARGTLYRNAPSQGWLASVSPSFDLTSRIRAGVTFGRRFEEGRLTDRRDQLDWFSTEFDLSLSYAWVWAGAAEWSNGTNERNTQYTSSLVYRF